MFFQGRKSLLAYSALAATQIGYSTFAVAQNEAAPVTQPVVAAAAAVGSAINSGDTAWMLASSAFVLLMTPGLAFFYGGMVRSKNAVSTMMQSFIALSVISLLWYFVGYSLAFAPGSAFLGGLGWTMFTDVGRSTNPDYSATFPHVLFAIYQCMFAIITPALIAGAIVERIKFSSYVLLIALWSILVYSPVAHWVWGVGGFLRTWGVLDFAGGTVVHQIAGFSALAAAIVLGKRTDFGKAETTPNSIPLIAIGTGLLWFGWFGFNGGSAVSSGDLAASAFTSTHFAAAAAGLAWGIMDKILKGKFSLVGVCIGIVVGLVAVTPASGFVTAGSGILIGIVGAVIVNVVCFIRAKTQIDDTLDVFACHGIGGLVGTLMTGLLCTKAINPAGADGGMDQFLIQLKSSVVVAAFAFAATFVIMKVIDMVIGLRPSSADETTGLDQVDHGEKTYTY